MQGTDVLSNHSDDQEQGDWRGASGEQGACWESKGRGAVVRAAPLSHRPFRPAELRRRWQINEVQLSRSFINGVKEAGNQSSEHIRTSLWPTGTSPPGPPAASTPNRNACCRPSRPPRTPLPLLRTVTARSNGAHTALTGPQQGRLSTVPPETEPQGAPGRRRREWEAARLKPARGAGTPRSGAPLTMLPRAGAPLTQLQPIKAADP